MNFRGLMRVWEHTREYVERGEGARTFAVPLVTKVRYSEADQMHILSQTLSCVGELKVENEDCLVVGRRLLDQGLSPMIHILADHRFPGGDVKMGSGAQEESLFRRTNLCRALKQTDFYPINADEAVVCLSATVFKSPEISNCEMLSSPFHLDFCACPGLQNPKLAEGLAFFPEQEQTLRKKIRLILQAAYRCRNDSVVLGPLGCGAWRNPPEQVARIMREEVVPYMHVFKVVVVACLEVDPFSYIVLHRDKPSNYVIFERELCGPGGSPSSR